jgi:Holliday junction resolvase
MRTNYHRGVEREHYIKKKLEKQGYFVIRSAGSHSPVDLVAIKRNEVRLIQSRKGRYIRPKEKEKIKEVEEITGFKVEVI